MILVLEGGKYDYEDQNHNECNQSSYFIICSFYIDTLSKYHTVNHFLYQLYISLDFSIFIITPHINLKPQLSNTTTMSSQLEESAILGLRAQILGKRTPRSNMDTADILLSSNRKPPPLQSRGQQHYPHNCLRFRKLDRRGLQGVWLPYLLHQGRRPHCGGRFTQHAQAHFRENCSLRLRR